MVTGIRHWSTPDYTRVAIDIDREVKYEAGRVANPDRIFFDLPDTKLASVLIGKSFDVQDGFLKKIRVAQYQPGYTRVVLEVADVSDYSAFLLPNPYRLIIDIHGRQPHAQTQVATGKSPAGLDEEEPAPAGAAASSSLARHRAPSRLRSPRVAEAPRNPLLPARLTTRTAARQFSQQTLRLPGNPRPRHLRARSSSMRMTMSRRPTSREQRRLRA